MTQPKPRHAIVTGGAGALGQAIAVALVKKGCKVSIVDVDEARLGDAREDFREHADKLHFIQGSVGKAQSVADAVSSARQAFGPVDILVNNAGVSGNGKPLSAITPDDLDMMFDTHIKGAFFFAQLASADMVEHGWGRIINIASHFAMVGHDNMSHYVSAKSALIGAAKAWAREFGPSGITVNAVAPALLDTPMTRKSIGIEEIKRREQAVPVGRLTRVDEIAALVGWLCSEEAATMTGQTLSPNGGLAIVGI